jgi:M6 family metalloprotease-like protein
MSLIQLQAVPAWRGALKAQQPDGSMITFYMQGDEFWHQCLTTDGYAIAQDPQGSYRYVRRTANGQPTLEGSPLVHDVAMRSAQEVTFVSQLKKEENTARRSSPRHTPKSSRFQIDGFPTTGEIKCLVILAEFNDLGFTYDFNFHQRMMNEQGFADEGAAGSAAQYFTEQSMGTFFPKFDVIGPVKLSKNYAYYGANDFLTGSDQGTGKMIEEACWLAHDQHGVNFADYDNNNDGQVDMVYVIYAGYGEAFGAGSDYVWPKKWQLQAEYITCTIDGKSIDVYACSAELYGNPAWEQENGGHRSSSIGTVCHEFGHVLGFADHYSTGESGVYRLGSYDIMDYGPYNNNGATPPAYNAFERITLGWMTPDTLGLAPLTNIPLEHIATSNKAYVLTTSNPNECYFIEARQNEGWDKYLPSSGMMITHLDFEATSWLMNIANNNNNHQRFYLVCADNDAVYDYMTGRQSERGDLYPYGGNSQFTDVSSPSAWTYTGETLDKWVTNIRNTYGIVVFDYRNNHLDIPDHLRASEIVANGFTAEWDAVSRADRYEVNLYRLMHESERPLAVSEGFWRMEKGSVSSPDGTNIADQLDDYMSQPGWTGEQVYQAGGSVKIGSAGASGKLVSPQLNLSMGEGVYTVVVKVQSLQGKTPVFTISSNGQQARTRLSSAAREYYATFQGGLTQTQIELASVSERAFIDTLVVIRGNDVATYFPQAKEVSVTGDIASTYSPEVVDPLIPCDTLTVETTDTHYRFTDLKTATNYCFEVRAMNNDMGSAYSDRFYLLVCDGTEAIHDQLSTIRHQPTTLFDLQGCRIVTPSKPGVYIKNGRKFAIR